MRITLCLNCLVKADVVEVPVGQEKGSQRDPYRDTLALCPPCAKALCEGDFDTLHNRYLSEQATTTRSVVK